jgi:hypothetical protein
MSATQDDDVDSERMPPEFYRGEHVYDMDEGDPEMEAWMDSLPPVDIDRLAQDLKQVETERGLPHQGAGPVWEEDPSTIWRCYDHWPHEEDYDKHTYSDGNAKCEVCGKRNFSVKPFTLR